MLFPGLERQAQRRTVTVVVRDADQAAREPPLQPVADGDVGRVRPAETHRQAEALRVAHRDVGSPVAGRFQQAESQRIGGCDHEAARFPHPLRQLLVVVDAAIGCRLLHQGREDAVRVERLVIADLDLDSERFGARADHFDRLRMAAFGSEEPPLSPLVGPAKRHRFGGGRRFVQQGGVRDVQPREVGDHRLEVQQRFQPALGDLRLVGRVGRVPTGVLEHVALDHGGRNAAVVAHADEASQHLIAARDLVELDQGLGFGGRRRQFEAAVGSFAADRRRYGRVDQARERGVPERLEHLLDLCGPGADVTVGEGQAAARCRLGNGHSFVKSQAT